MKKIIFIFTLFFTQLLFAQSYKFGWITDLHIGAPNADSDLESVVSYINSLNELQFTIVSGDIAEKGRNLELESAKNILDKLKKPYYIIPGNHDTKWSESGTLKFKELWGDDKFYFEYKNSAFIGINSGILMRGGGGHVTPEDLIWLEKKLKSVPKSKEIFFVIHHPLNSDVDNWYKVSNILANYDIKLIMCGHEHAAKLMDFNGFQGVMGRSTLTDSKVKWGFNVVENSADSLFFTTVDGDSVVNRWGAIKKSIILTVPQIDSLDFINYSAQIISRNDLQSTVSASPITWDGKIFVNQFNGIISCFDSTGKMLWDFDQYSNSISRPLISDDILVSGTLSGDLYTLNPKTGSSILSIGFNQPITSQLISIDYNGSYSNIMLPKETESKKAIILGTNIGNVFCYDLETLQELWVNKDSKGMIETAPLFYKDKLIFGSWDNYIYSLDSRKGWLIWKQTVNKNFYYSTAVAPPVTDGKNVFVSSPDKNIYSIDINLGKINKSIKCDAWESFSISDDGKKLYVKGMKDVFYFVSTDKLAIIKDFNIEYGLDTMPSTPLEWNNNIIFGSKNGNVYQIDRTNNVKKLFFMGNSRILSIQKLDENKFVAVNMDGKIVVFSLLGDN